MDQPNTPDRADLVTPTPASPSAPAQPLTPSAWLMQNGPFIVVLGLALLFVYTRYGGDVIVKGVMAGLGIGFIIFIHELGHFLAAKWCDVHVMTFSIGFGPAIPGLSFTRGETTYKVAILPLGGFVNMVGEGPEADEEEDYPRSFKNKTVWQRMLIISAGVFMNIAFGAACFIGVYLTTGVSRLPAVVAKTEPGSRAWENGVRSGWTVSEVGGRVDPWWNQMQSKVIFSSKGHPIPFTFTDLQGKTHDLEIEPFRDDNNAIPIIGVAPPSRLELVSARYKSILPTPVSAVCAAANARVIDLKQGDVVVRASSGDDVTILTPLPAGNAGWLELGKRLAKHPNVDIDLEIRRAGKTETETITVPPVGFEFGDSILGMTDPMTPNNPYNVTPIRVTNVKGSKRPVADFFDYRSRTAALAGEPIVMQVRRANTGDSASEDAAVVSIFVPPAYTFGFGARMNMGKIAGIRIGSPASKSGLATGPTAGDVITGVKLFHPGKKEPITFGEKALDPVRLPFELENTIRKSGLDVSKWTVVLTVQGANGHESAKTRTLDPMAWDDSFSLIGESPRSRAAPMSIPQLGIAYWVMSTVLKVDPGSAAEAAGLMAGDEIQQINFRSNNPTKPDEIKWAGWGKKMSSRRGPGLDLYDQWAYYFTFLQLNDYPQFRLKVKRGSEVLELPPEGETDGIVATPIVDWPMPERGLNLIPDSRQQKAKSVLEAIQFGIEDTVESTRNIYMSLSRLVTRRISLDNIGGPIEIATQAFNVAGEDFSTNFLFLAMISINLAVVNFLPIPLLDGGHMVFLIYEKIRRRPPPEVVVKFASLIGVVFILSLMVFVLYLDISRRWF